MKNEQKNTLLVIVGIGVMVFNVFSFQEKEDKCGPVLGEASVMKVMLSFIETASNNENKNIDALKEITTEEQEIIYALKLTNLERNEKMINFERRSHILKKY